MHVPLAIVGAGPAGLAAAIAAARRLPPHSVLILDRLPAPAVKLARTGGGRGNLSHLAGENDFAAAFGPAGRFIVPAYRALTPTALRNRLHAIGLPTVVDPEKRIYPASQSAADLRQTLLSAATAATVRIQPSSPVAAIDPTPDGWRIHLANTDAPIAASALILAPGGCAMPALGSDGSGHRLAAALGHRIITPVPALAPLLVDDAPWLPPLAGITLPDAALRFALPGRLIYAPRHVSRGSLLFTHRGLSGPAALNLSGTVARALARKTSFTLILAVLPSISRDECRAFLNTLRQTDGARPLRRILSPPLPQRLVDTFLDLASIPPDTPAARLTAPAADRLATALCALRLTVTHPAPFAESMVTSGGVSLKEVDPATLASRLHPNLYFAGEILDLDAPEGGYNLHWAFSSGTLAAHSAAHSLCP